MTHSERLRKLLTRARDEITLAEDWNRAHPEGPLRDAEVEKLMVLIYLAHRSQSHFGILLN